MFYYAPARATRDIGVANWQFRQSFWPSVRDHTVLCCIMVAKHIFKILSHSDSPITLSFLNANRCYEIRAGSSPRNYKSGIKISLFPANKSMYSGNGARYIGVLQWSIIPKSYVLCGIVWSPMTLHDLSGYFSYCKTADCQNLQIYCICQVLDHSRTRKPCCRRETARCRSKFWSISTASSAKAEWMRNWKYHLTFSGAGTAHNLYWMFIILRIMNIQVIQSQPRSYISGSVGRRQWIK